MVCGDFLIEIWDNWDKFV